MRPFTTGTFLALACCARLTWAQQPPPSPEDKPAEAKDAKPSAEDPSKPKGAPPDPQLAAALIPRRCPDARTRAVPAPIVHSAGCPQK